jgi:hypothetical protein
MTWTCLNTEERLSDFLEAQLEAAERLAMEAHLQSCAACRTLVAEVGTVVAQLARVEQEVEPSWLVYRVLEATSGAVREKEESPWRRALAGVLAPRFALGLGSVAATLFILFQALGINLRHVNADDLNPINVLRAADRQAHLTYARGVRFVNDLRVVYEIRSRLQEAAATPNEPQQQQEERTRPAGTSSPQSERKLRNDLLLRHSGQIAVALFAGLPGGGPR